MKNARTKEWGDKIGIFENIYQRMMTYDRTALAIVITFYTIIWTILNIKLYKQLLDIDISKKRKTIWFFLEVISISFGKIMFPASVYNVCNRYNIYSINFYIKYETHNEYFNSRKKK